MTTTDRFLEDLKGRYGMNEKMWVKDVKTKWKPPEGLFTQSAKEIADTVAKASDDYATAVRRVVFYYNRAGVCNKNGNRFDAKECKKACQVLKLLRKHFKVSDRDAAKSELNYCSVSESNEASVPEGESINEVLLALAEQVLDYAIDYGAEVATAGEVDETQVQEYQQAAANAFDKNPDKKGIGLDFSVEGTSFGVEITISPSDDDDLIFFPDSFSFPDDVNGEGVNIDYGVAYLSILDTEPETRNLDEKTKLLDSILKEVDLLVPFGDEDEETEGEEG